MTAIPVGLQLYSVREDCKKDLAGTLKEVARMGYDGVEFAGFYDIPAEDIARMLKDAGLRCCGSHTPYADLLPDRLQETAAFNRAIGNKYLIAPSLPKDQRSSKAGWYAAAETLNKTAAALAPQGMSCGYHNHNFEFAEVEGEVPWDVLLSNTTEDVILQLDTGNALYGGADPVALLSRCAHRAETIHLKEYSASDDKAVIGEGDIDWPAVFSLLEKAGKTKWYIVEQESYALEPLECVARCRENLRRMGV